MEISANNSMPFTSHNRGNLTADLDLAVLKSSPGFWIIPASGFTLFVLGFPLNTWVLWLVVRDRQQIMSSDIFTLNLTVMDGFYCLISPLFWFSIYFSSTSMFFLMIFFNGFTLVGKALFQCCICVERYLAVVHPVTYLKYKPLMYRVTCSGVVWLIAVGFGVLTVLSSPGFPDYELSAVCVAMLAVSVFSSVAILKVLRMPGPGNRVREEMNPIKRRAFTTVLIILVLTVLSYFPFPIAGILNRKGIIPTVYLLEACNITFFLYMTSSIVKPLLFLSRAGKLSCCRRTQ